MAEETNAIEVRDVHKTFRLPHEQYSSLKNRLLHIKNRKKGFENQHVLKGVSFEVKKGEFFGIVGRNGSGKSTLLKLMAGVYVPDSGEIKVNGTLSPFIELGVGFNAELTGRENVFMNGALLGFTRKQMSKMYDEIVEFAELEKFMDQKLKNYSSGMQVRLAFSIAIRAQGDILLLDEVLAVGDAAFQQKCFDYFAELKRNKKTIILVTHSMPMVERFCDRSLLLDSGEVAKVGESSEIAGLYEDIFLEDENSRKTTVKTEDKEEKKELTSPVRVALSIMQSGRKVNAVKARQDFSLSIDVDSQVDIADANLGVNIRDDQDRVVFSTDIRKSVDSFGLEKGKKKHIDLELHNYYTNGKYTIDVHIVNKNGESNKVVLKRKKIHTFLIMGVIDHAHSMFHPPFKVDIT